MSRTWYVSASGTGDGSDATKPAPMSRIMPQINGVDPKTVLLNGGDRFAFSLQFPKQVQNLTVSNYGNDRAIIDAPTGMLFNLAVGNIDVSGIDFIDSSRDPNRPGFAPHVGGYGFLMLSGDNCNLHLHDCSMKWHAIGVAVQTAQHQYGTLMERLMIGPTYGIGQRSQGVYAEGQWNAKILASGFNNCGWWKTIAPAINQNHSIYWHGGDAQACGPLTCQQCTFYNAAAGGPTSNTGGIVTDNFIVDCANDGSGMAAWISGDYAGFGNNTVIGGFYNAISKQASVVNNRFIVPGPLAVNVDIPEHSTGWRAPTNQVICSGNLGLGMTAPVVRVNNAGGGQVIDELNMAIPSDGGYADAIRQHVRQQLGVTA